MYYMSPIYEKTTLSTKFNNNTARLYKLHESGNGTKISVEKWRSAKTKYLESKKW